MILCLDIGNTHLDYGLLNRRQIMQHGKIATARLDRDDGLKALLTQYKREPVEGVAVASVVPAATRYLQTLLDTLNYNYPVLCLSGRQCPGLAITYPVPEEIGPDMLAGSIAAQSLYGTPALVVSLGTALAIAVLTEAGYEGGVVAPGLMMMSNVLHEKTALLPPLDLAELRAATGAVGRSTPQAMAIGCRVGFIGMVTALVKHVTTDLSTRGYPVARIAVTGGNAGMLPPDWHPRAVYHPHLNLIGLAEAFRRWHG